MCYPSSDICILKEGRQRVRQMLNPKQYISSSDLSFFYKGFLVSRTPPMKYLTYENDALYLS